MGSVAIFAAVLFAVGGFIAWSGDRLGTWVGKKRLSKFGLRPKHTAMLYTIFSGSLIAVLTLGVLLTYDKDVSRALTHGRQIIADNARMARKNRVAQAELTNTLNQLQVAQDGRVLAENQRKIAQFDRTIAEDETRLADQKLLKSQHNLGLADQNLNTTRAQLTAEKLSLDVTTSALHTAEISMRSADQTLVATKQTLAVEQAKVAAEQSVVAQLTSQQAELVHKNQTLVAANADLEKKNVSSYPLNKVMYHQGDQIGAQLGGRAVISTDLSPADIRHALDSWLDTVSKDADTQGAAGGPNGRTVVVETVVTNAANGSDLASTESDKLDLLAESIAAQKGIVSSVVVVASARDNALIGEQVKLAVQAFDNVLVFNKGETIANATIDGTGEADDIVASLSKFLRDTVRPVARSRNIMPIIDPTTRESTYGEVVEKWGDIVKQIQAMGATAHVYAITDRDIYTEGPLSLDLKVEPGAPATPTSGASTPATGRSAVLEQTPVIVR